MVPFETMTAAERKKAMRGESGFRSRKGGVL